MIRYYFLQFFRTIKRDKTSFFINLMGLSTGLACAILIFLWVQAEIDMDKFHEKDEQLFQVMIKIPALNDTIIQEWTQGLLAQSLVEEMPEIENAVSVIPPDWFRTPGIMSNGKKKIKVKEQYVGKDYFNMFSYNLIYGDKSNVLIDNYSVVLSDELAIKLFNSTDNLIGRTIDWNRDGEDNKLTRSYTISGIFTKPSTNSSVQFDAVFNYTSFFKTRQDQMESWTNQDPSTYITLKEGVDFKQFNGKIKNFVKTKVENTDQTLFVRPFSDKYLYDNYENGVQAGGRIVYVRLFTSIGLLILIIACINFMNMTTAMASKKSKGVGIRKVLGANKKILLLQYMLESLFMVLISLIVAIGLVLIFLPSFNLIVGEQLGLNFSIRSILFLFFLVFFTAIVSGSYPSLYLAKFNPIKVLKGKLNTSFGESFIRKGLVIFQFSISIILILASLTIYRQIKFMQTKNLGYNKNNVIWFKKDGGLVENVNAFISDIKSFAGVINVSDSRTNLTGEHGRTTPRLSIEGNEVTRLNFNYMSVNYGFIETLGMKIVEGRSFSKDFGSEQSKIIFNETAIKKLGIKQPIGKMVNLWRRDWEIIGIVEDFNLESLHDKIEPFFFQLMQSGTYGNNIWVKIQAGTEVLTIEQLAKSYNKFNPGLTFEFSFLDDDVQAIYESERRIAVLSRYFSVIAIIISCLGVFGLVAFTIQRRTKEIGIRKVNGSSAFGILKLITNDFLLLVIVSLIIALPIGYLIIRNWLNDFAYKIELEWWMFVGSGLAVLIIALVTIGIQSLKAANIDPVICLVDE